MYTLNPLKNQIMGITPSTKVSKKDDYTQIQAYLGIIE